MRRSLKDEKLFSDANENFVTLGKCSYIEPSVLAFGGHSNILGGRYSSLASGICFLMGGNHSLKSVSSWPFNNSGVVKEIFGNIRPGIKNIFSEYKHHLQVIFGHDVWIGRDVMIMGGVKIGNGAAIGARAVVAKDIPPYAIVVGNPARVIKYRFDEETIRKFLAVKWWNWDLEKIADNFPLMNDVEKFLDAHYSPELEEFPEDEFTRQLDRCTGGGYLPIYHRLPSAESAVA